MKPKGNIFQIRNDSKNDLRVERNAATTVGIKAVCHLVSQTLLIDSSSIVLVERSAGLDRIE
jgi:hypothetical protein